MSLTYIIIFLATILYGSQNQSTEPYPPCQGRSADGRSPTSLVLKGPKGYLDSRNMYMSVQSGCRIEMPHDFGTEKHTLLLYVKRVSLKSRRNVHIPCQRNLWLYGHNLCLSPPGACYVIQRENQLCESMKQELKKCSKQYWTFEETPYFPALYLSRPKAAYLPSANIFFEIGYTFMSCTAENAPNFVKDTGVQFIKIKFCEVQTI
ncbi:uncharacterized protein LOC144427366 isoform X2 [Styela clava]